MGASIAFMTAADYDEISNEDTSPGGHGYYTKLLLQACSRPTADNEPRDGYLTFWEAHSYAKSEIDNFSSQTPQNRNNKQLRNYILMTARVAAPVTIGPTSSFSPVRPTFSWKAVDGARYYRLLALDSSGRSVIQQTNIQGLSWTPSFDLPKGSYTWKMSALSYAQNQGPFSRTKAFAVNDDSNPPPPSGPYLLRITLTSASYSYCFEPAVEVPNFYQEWMEPPGPYGSNGPPFATLSHPSTNVWNIDVCQYMPCGSAVYRFWVRRNPLAPINYTFGSSGARVTVQSPTRTLYTFTPPTDYRGDHYWWHVFNMTGNGTIIPVKKLPSYYTPP